MSQHNELKIERESGGKYQLWERNNGYWRRIGEARRLYIDKQPVTISDEMRIDRSAREAAITVAISGDKAHIRP